MIVPAGSCNERNRCYGCHQPFCPLCGTCEETDCYLNGLKIGTRTELIEAGLVAPRSQKVLGYQVLARSVLGQRVPRPFAVVQEADDIDVAWKRVSVAEGQIMARPCPKRPRHGFVESRAVLTPSEVRLLLSQAQAVEPEAELLLCPFFPAMINMVVTPIGMAIGPGHAGATAGVDSMMIPLVEHHFQPLDAPDLKRAGIGAQEDTFLEAVADQCSYVITQLRGGVRLPRTRALDYIPTQVRVSSVVMAAGNLLEWEAKTATFRPGTVVYHPGGTMMSHYALHCVRWQIPIVHTYQPCIGEVLKPTKAIVKADPDAVADGIAVGWAMPIGPLWEPLLRMMMVALHNATVMGGDHGFYLGAAAAIMHRFGSAAAVGEMAHSKNVGGAVKCIGKHYRAVLDRQKLDARPTLGTLADVFKHGAWAHSYGGPAWHECVMSVIDLDRCMWELMHGDRSDLKVARLVSAVNASVSKAHNTGWWLNKFVSSSAFQAASVQDLDNLLRSALGFHYTTTHRSVKADIAAGYDYWLAAHPLVIPSQGQKKAGKPKSVAPAPREITQAHGCYLLSKDEQRVIFHIQYRLTGMSGEGEYERLDVPLYPGTWELPAGMTPAGFCAMARLHPGAEKSWSGSGGLGYFPLVCVQLSFDAMCTEVKWRLVEPIMGGTTTLYIAMKPSMAAHIHFENWSEMVATADSQPRVEGE